MIRIGAWLPVQVAQTVLSQVLTEQNIGVRNRAVSCPAPKIKSITTIPAFGSNS